MGNNNIEMTKDILTRWGQGQAGALTGSTRCLVHNDLYQTLAHWKCQDLYIILEWMYDTLPMECYGSPEKVKAWAEAHSRETTP